MEPSTGPGPNGNGNGELGVQWGDKRLVVHGIAVIIILATAIVGGLVLWTAREATRELNFLVTKVLDNQVTQMNRVVEAIQDVNATNHADHEEIRRKWDVALCVLTMTPLQKAMFAAQYIPGREYMVCPWLSPPQR